MTELTDCIFIAAWMGSESSNWARSYARLTLSSPAQVAVLCLFVVIYAICHILSKEHVGL